MNAYTLVTNNSRMAAGANEQLGERFEIAFVPGGLEDIYEALGEKLQNGYRLVSSPLPVNVPLTRSPVRSVILQKSHRRFHAEGLLMLERAKTRTSTLGINTDPRVLADLEMIDQDQLRCTISQLEDAFA